MLRKNDEMKSCVVRDSKSEKKQAASPKKSALL